MGPLGGPQGVSPIIPLFPFRVNRGLLTLSDAVRCIEYRKQGEMHLDEPRFYLCHSVLALYCPGHTK